MANKPKLKSRPKSRKKPVRQAKRKNTKKLIHKHVLLKLLLGVLIVLALIFAIYLIIFKMVQPRTPDAFYTPPKVLPSTVVGTLIRSEKISTDVQGADSYRVLYVSRDENDEPIAVSGNVFVPQTALPVGGRQTVAWAHPTTGVADQCAPSLMASSTTAHLPGVQEMINAGYVVTATDYQGLGTPGPHPYLIGRSEAYGVLDSVRAAKNIPGSYMNGNFAIWGHSQGGQATIYASQKAASYAPELNLVASAAAAPATNLTTLLKNDLTTETGKVLGPMAFKAWSEIYPAATFDKIVKPDAVAAATMIAKGCIETKNQTEVLLPPIAALPQEFVSQDPSIAEPWAGLITSNSPSPSRISTPLFIAQGSTDVVVSPAVTQDWAKQLCNSNNQVTYKLYDGVGHIPIGFVSVNDVLPWFANAFNGKSSPGNCDTI